MLTPIEDQRSLSKDNEDRKSRVNCIQINLADDISL